MATGVLGIDIGGSGIKAAPVDPGTGELLAPRMRIPTPEGAKPMPMAKVVAELARQFQWTGPIGCGFPAVIRKGVAYSAANIHKSWLGMNVSELFAAETACPVTVVNDADAAGLAEMKFGAGKDFPKGVVIIVTIGTGIGTPVFVNHQLLPNTELGHIEIRGKDAETRTSDAIRQQNDWSWKKWSKRFDEYLNTLERLLWPDVFILGGGASKQFDEFAPFLSVHAQVIPARLLNMAGIVGASLAAAGEFLGG